MWPQCQSYAIIILNYWVANWKPIQFPLWITFFLSHSLSVSLSLCQSLLQWKLWSSYDFHYCSWHHISTTNYLYTDKNVLIILHTQYTIYAHVLQICVCVCVSVCMPLKHAKCTSIPFWQWSMFIFIKHNDYNRYMKINKSFN